MADIRFAESISGYAVKTNKVGMADTTLIKCSTTKFLELAEVYITDGCALEGSFAYALHTIKWVFNKLFATIKSVFLNLCYFALACYAHQIVAIESEMVAHTGE